MIYLKVDLRSGGTLAYGNAPLKKLMRQVGGEIAARAKSLIRAKADGKKRVSTPGQPPVSRTGQLLSKIKVSVSRSGKAVSVVDTAGDQGAYYALFLEQGAKGGGGNTHSAANILLAGEMGKRGNVLRGHNRMKASAINRTRVLLPHPFLSRALADVAAAGLDERIVAAVESGITFERGKMPK